MTGPRHHVITRGVLAARQILHARPAHPTLPRFLATADLSPVSMVSAFPECHNVGTAPAAAFSRLASASPSFPGEIDRSFPVRAGSPPPAFFPQTVHPLSADWGRLLHPGHRGRGHRSLSLGSLLMVAVPGAFLPFPSLNVRQGSEGSPELSKLLSSVGSFRTSAHQTPQRNQDPQTPPSVLSHSPQA